jgi:hypothetical protein
MMHTIREKQDTVSQIFERYHVALTDHRGRTDVPTPVDPGRWFFNVQVAPFYWR